MKKTTNTKGFTLVELIIVITILAILATVAFVSFQGYSADAKDSKVKSDLATLQQAIETFSANGTPLTTFVGNTGSNLNSGIAIAGAGTGTFSNTIYAAGDINKTALGNVKLDTNYKIGATTKAGGAYQIAGVLTKDVKSSYVVGNYGPRGTTAITVTGNSTANTVTLTGTGIGFFKKGDTTNFGVVSSISSDLTTITLTGTVTA